MRKDLCSSICHSRIEGDQGRGSGLVSDSHMLLGFYLILGFGLLRLTSATRRLVADFTSTTSTPCTRYTCSEDNNGAKRPNVEIQAAPKAHCPSSGETHTAPTMSLTSRRPRSPPKHLPGAPSPLIPPPSSSPPA